jgi:eukaryotic-like serine/threonine-protein kinase
MKHCTVCKTKYEDSVSFCPVDGEVLEDDPSSMVGTVLDGQYQMETLLGKGGMGAVYSARHILLGDRVAIKVLPPEVRTNAEWLRRFRREGQAARRFRHANAVTVYDLRTAADGTIYMVMEYVEGHTLDAEIRKRGRFTAAEAFEILTPIMSVLDTAHSMGVVHRDLKPENIMIGTPGGNGAPVIKLLDLGIAKMREIAGVDSAGNTALTMAGQVLGTPYYMSPEQWGEIPRDENLEIDGRADIYSLGLVFYEMIAGRRCFSGTTLHELRREHVTTQPRPLIEVVPNVPQGFSAAIERATAKDRGDRQPTTAVLAEELRAGLNTAISSAETSSRLGELSETVAITNELQTKSDGNAPTVLTMDPSATSALVPGSATSAPPVREVPPPRPVVSPPPDPAMSAGTVVESAAMASSVTIPQAPKIEPAVPSVSPPAPAPAKGKLGLVIGAVVVLLLLIAGGVGGYFIWTRTRTPSTSTGGTTRGGTGSTVAPPRDAGRYWLEVEAKAGQPSTQVAALVPIASGQSLKMHFVFSESGYVYIVGPGEGNKPTAFLTSKPPEGSGLTTNLVSQNADFSFPSGESNYLTLDKNPGTDVFTIIFSKTVLASPGFLNEPTTFKPLTTAQQTELSEFVRKNQEKPLLELDESNSRAPFMRVKVAQNQTGNPIVFDIRIQHN